MLHFDSRPDGALMLDDIAGANFITIDFHEFGLLWRVERIAGVCTTFGGFLQGGGAV